MRNLDSRLEPLYLDELGVFERVRIRPKQDSWCRRGESNPRPRDYETLALPLSYAGPKTTVLCYGPASKSVKFSLILAGTVLRPSFWISERTNADGTVVPLSRAAAKSNLPVVAVLSGVLRGERVAKEPYRELCTGTLQVHFASYLTLVC